MTGESSRTREPDGQGKAGTLSLYARYDQIRLFGYWLTA